MTSIFSALKHSPSKRTGKRDSIKKLTADGPDNGTTSGTTSGPATSSGNGKIHNLKPCSKEIELEPFNAIIHDQADLKSTATFTIYCFQIATD